MAPLFLCVGFVWHSPSFAMLDVQTEVEQEKKIPAR